MRRLMSVSVVLGVALVGGACTGKAAESASAQSVVAVVQLAPETVVTAALGEISSGPTISGALVAAREATVRTQVGGSIVALPVDRGQHVASGAEVARISSRDLEASYESAQTAVKSAEATLGVAQSEAQRTETLVKGGALAARDLEQARNVVSSTEAQLAAARARQRTVWQQLDDTSVKAPFAGIVSSRLANMGDVIASGAQILTIVDPSSMQLEALVPSDYIQEVRPGSKVRFNIRGVAGPFTGTVDRISPVADPVTRQVSIFVVLPNLGGKLISGLFAEGRVESATRRGVVVPLSAVDETGPAPTVTRIRDGKAERVQVSLGPRQSETEQVEVAKGVATGDVLIIGSAKGVAAGTPVKVIR